MDKRGIQLKSKKGNEQRVYLTKDFLRGGYKKMVFIRDGSYLVLRWLLEICKSHKSQRYYSGLVNLIAQGG